MKAKDMLYVDYGSGGDASVLKVERCEIPQPKEDEVLVKIAFAGVNRPDIAQRIGRYPPPVGASPIMGLEVSGTIVELGRNGSEWAVGDEVCALVPGGGYAEYCVVPASHCLPVPRGLSLEQAAALPETCFTVWDNVFTRSGLKSGESFLVHGGGGGIGVTAIQMASAMGARVITTVGSASKVAFCEALGAERVVNYREEDFVKESLEFTAGKGIDVVLDMVGGTYLDRDLDALAMDGRIALIAFMGGVQATIDVTKVLKRRALIGGSTLRPRSKEYKAEIARALRDKWWPKLIEERLRPVIHAVFPLAQAKEAHELMESSDHSGKIVLSVEGA